MHVVDRYNEGLSPEGIWCEYPTLTLAMIHKSIGFYLENRSEVDSYIAQCRAKIDRQMAEPSHGPGLIELRRRLEARQRAEMTGSGAPEFRNRGLSS
jgi:hypothetical protein